MGLSLETGTEVGAAKGSPRRLGWLALAPLAAVALFLLARHFSRLSVDFIVYHSAARSFLAGRTDLYSDTFAWGPPMLYVYPPLFLLLFFPLGWLPFADAYGVWFAGWALAVGAMIYLAYREWPPQRVARYWLILLFLAGVPVLYALKNGNAHLGVVLFTLAGLLAWSKEKSWVAALCLALGGAVKLFSLILLPFLLVRREWKLAAKVVFISCLLWAAPLVYYGPNQTIDLYRGWYHSVPGDVAHFEDEHQLDSSVSGATRRWLTHIDYSQHRDKRYPEVNWVNLPAKVVQGIGWILKCMVMGISIGVAWMLPGTRALPKDERAARHRLNIAAISSLFISAQLLFGPYTIFLYLCGWLVLALCLPVVFEHVADKLNYVLLAIGVVNVAVLALPGRSIHRALESYGVFTLLNFSLWLICVAGGWKLCPRPSSLFNSLRRQGK